MRARTQGDFLSIEFGDLLLTTFEPGAEETRLTSEKLGGGQRLLAGQLDLTDLNGSSTGRDPQSRFG